MVVAWRILRTANTALRGRTIARDIGRTLPIAQEPNALAQSARVERRI